jgi:hypothetical protein
MIVHSSLHCQLLANAPLFHWHQIFIASCLAHNGNYGKFVQIIVHLDLYKPSPPSEVLQILNLFHIHIKHASLVCISNKAKPSAFYGENGPLYDGGRLCKLNCKNYRISGFTSLMKAL